MPQPEIDNERVDILQSEEVIQDKKYALISVSDKTGVVDFAKLLVEDGYTIISTGGTGQVLESAGVAYTPIKEITGNPESFDGRMKTISFQVESGLLFDRTNAGHVAEAESLHIPRIDIVVCNLYPFEQTLRNPGATHDEIVENIDVGGPTMVRSGAKNYKNVLVLVNPDDYVRVAEEVRRGSVSIELRQELAAKAFQHLSFYDAQIAQFLTKERFPEEMVIPLRRGVKFRYGTNPDQEGYLFEWPGKEGIVSRLRWYTGREPSETNITDIVAGARSVRLFDTPAVAIIKHNTPCGIALGDTIAEALTRAIESDPTSAFGGVVVLNQAMTEEAAHVIEAFKKAGKGGMDVIAAPEITEGVREFLHTVRPSTGIYEFGSLEPVSPDGLVFRWVDGGMTVQKENDPESSFDAWQMPTDKKPTEEQIENIKAGWKFLARIRSNASIVMDAAKPMVRGIGAMKTSRIETIRGALEAAGEHGSGGYIVTDGFLPFADWAILAETYGIVGIVQPGGSVRDQESIDAANKLGMWMILTGQRLFEH